jgi:cell division protein FtsZ
LLHLLDGQQPETKSVINMVHRIQNRNPGYSDFSNIMDHQHHLTFLIRFLIPISHGANALKVENEIVSGAHSTTD